MSPTDWVRWTDKYGDQHADYVASVKNQSQAEAWAKSQDEDASKISTQKTGIVERGYTDADGTRKGYQLNEDGTVTALAYGKPTFTEHDKSNAEPGEIEGGVPGGVEGGKVGSELGGKGTEEPKPNDPLDIVDKVNSGTGMTNSVIDTGIEAAEAEAKTTGAAMNGLKVATRGLGGISAGIDAGIAIKQAYDNPTAGNITKAAIKGALLELEVFGKVNPVVGIVTDVLDLTGATDALFRW
ncbi:hypothetical protein A8C56_02835 [Niabella ginsenosidivorans]|uniref:Uncharacterized protein n=1 Tax=Niabella ginsenosidivorans TaxID=1176587 RepID=A0A1A9HZ33_9BACT|nr:hypothetical protein [Niabella ginsenosidivorans]ANH80059.1 hypothetical protein A8C56_02835 [Niabella ginsenosidivorans]